MSGNFKLIGCRLKWLLERGLFVEFWIDEFYNFCHAKDRWNLTKYEESKFVTEVS